MKEALRKVSKEQRSKLSSLELANRSSYVVEKLLPFITKYEKIGIYLPMKGEVDVTALLAMDRSFFAPVVKDDEQMEFYHLASREDVQLGMFGILQPSSKDWISPEALEVIIVPLVAFDETLHRLGQGRGYYDRYLKKTKAIKIGVGFEIQRFPEVPNKPFDVRLDYIVSEAKLYHR